MDPSLGNAVLGSGSEFRISATFLSWNTSTMYECIHLIEFVFCPLKIGVLESTGKIPSMHFLNLLGLT